MTWTPERMTEARRFAGEEFRTIGHEVEVTAVAQIQARLSAALDELERAAPILERLRELQRERQQRVRENWEITADEDMAHDLLDLYERQYGGSE